MSLSDIGMGDVIYFIISTNLERAWGRAYALERFILLCAIFTFYYIRNPESRLSTIGCFLLTLLSYMLYLQSR